jgi:hypothetical protein
MKRVTHYTLGISTAPKGPGTVARYYCTISVDGGKPFPLPVDNEQEFSAIVAMLGLPGPLFFNNAEGTLVKESQ